MTIVSLVLLILTFLASLVASWLLLLPFFDEEYGPDDVRIERRIVAGDLLQKREFIFQALEELEIDLRSGRIDEYAYQRAKEELSAEAAMQLDKIDKVSSKLANDTSQLS